MFGLEQQHIDAICVCFAGFPAIREVVIYGSRVKGNYKNGSDIDCSVRDDMSLVEKNEVFLCHCLTNG
ncbi:MAG: nucleotidyltransferase domain-containing protein [Planctomycetaceae bacterium]|jgi:predicted nucleotidyltransferase|nr:nucleotidyltransferase domain-containing protein [Planctomycetaceae bacterium]